MPADAVGALQAHRPGPGRPLSPKRAWALLELLDGGQAPWLTSVARCQVRAQLRRLGGVEATVWRDALRGREVRHLVRAHHAAIARLSNTEGVWLAGPAAAPTAGADLVVVDALPEFYVATEHWAALAAQLHVTPAVGRPDVAIRVPAALWPFGPAGPGRAVLAASLLDSGEWRAARAGTEILNELSHGLGAK